MKVWGKVYRNAVKYEPTDPLDFDKVKYTQANYNSTIEHEMQHVENYRFWYDMTDIFIFAISASSFSDKTECEKLGREFVISSEDSWREMMRREREHSDPSFDSYEQVTLWQATGISRGDREKGFVYADFHKSGESIDGSSGSFEYVD